MPDTSRIAPLGSEEWGAGASLSLSLSFSLSFSLSLSLGSEEWGAGASLSLCLSVSLSLSLSVSLFLSFSLTLEGVRSGVQEQHESCDTSSSPPDPDLFLSFSLSRAARIP